MIVGEAHVVIRAIGDKLKGDIEKSLSDAGKASGKRGGNAAGEEMTKNIKAKVNSNIDDSLEPIVDSASKVGRVAGNKAGEKLTEGIRENLKKSSPKLGAAGGGIGERIGNSMANGFERSRFNRAIVGAAIKLSVLTPIVGAVVGGLSALVSGLFAVVAATGTAAASSIALVGALSAVGQAAVFGMIGFKGVGEALKLAFDPEKAEEFAKALDELPKGAQEFVKTIKDMEDGFNEVKKTVQNNMFPGVVRGLTELRTLFPVVLKGAKITALGIGSGFERLANSFNNNTFKKNLGDMFRQNAPVISDFGESLGSLVRVVVALVDAAGPLTQRFSDWFEGWSENLADVTESANATGRLTEYFAKAGDAAALLGSIFSNMFEGLYEIGQIAQPVGMSLLRTFDTAMKSMADYTDSVENVANLREYFGDVEENVLSISTLVKDLGGAFARLGADPGVKKTADALAAIVPELEAALSASIENIGPKLAELVGEIAELFTVLEESNAVAYAITVFSTLANALNTVLSIPGIGDLAKVLIGIAAAMKALSLAAKLGGFAFSGVIGGLTGMNKAVERSTGTVSKASGPMRAHVADIMYMSRESAKGAVGVGRLGKAAAGTSGAISGMRMKTQEARAGFRNMNKDGLKAGAAMAAISVAASGVGENIIGANTAAMAVSGGMLAGPWGAAAGAVGGFALDIFQTSQKMKAEIASVKESVDAAMSEGSLAGKYTALEGIDKQIDDKAASIQKKKSWQKFLPPTGLIGGLVMFKTKMDQKSVNEFNKEKDRLTKSIQENEYYIDLSARLSFAQTRLDLNTFVKEQRKNKIPLTLDLNKQSGVNLTAQLKQYADAAKATGDTGMLEDAAKKIARIGREAGLSNVRAGALAKGLTNVKGAIKGVPDEKLVNLSVKDKKFLQRMGVTQEQLKKIEKGAEARITAKDEATKKIQTPMYRAEAFGKLRKSATLTANDQASAKAVAARNAIDLVKSKGVRITADYNGQEPGFFGSLAAQISRLTSKTITVTTVRKARGGDPGGNIPAAATGGWMHGPGTSTSDSIVARLSNGEFVVRAAMAKKNRALLEAINSGRGVNAQLPKAKFYGTDGGKGGNGGPRGSRIIGGELRLHPDGRAFIRGEADDVYNGNAGYDDAIGRMN